MARATNITNEAKRTREVAYVGKMKAKNSLLFHLVKYTHIHT